MKPGQLSYDPDDVQVRYQRHYLSDGSSMVMIFMGVVITAGLLFYQSAINRMIQSVTRHPLLVDQIPPRLQTAELPVFWVVLSGLLLVGMGVVSMFMTHASGTYIVLNDSIVAVQGYPPDWVGSSFFGDTKQVPFDQISGVDPDDTFMGGLFGFGHVIVHRSTNNDLLLYGCPDHRRMVRYITEKTQEYKRDLYGEDQKTQQ